MEGHIFIYGEIDSNWGVNTASVQKQLMDNIKAEKIVVHINSVGGNVFEGWAIHDILINCGKEVQTQIEGVCASIATIPFLAGSIRLISENSELMIHNPFTWGEGTASDLEKQAEQLREIEDKIASYYSLKTGITVDELKNLMTAETFMNAETAIAKGFATGTLEKMKAVAKLNINEKLNNMGLTGEDKSWFESIFAKLFEKKINAKALMIADADGKNLDFGDQIQEESQIVVGMTAKFEDGTIPTGEVVLPSGTILVFDNGTITEIKEIEIETEEIAALKTENEKLKSEIEALKATQAKLPTLESLKDSMQSEFLSLMEERVDRKNVNPESRISDLKSKLK